VLADAQGRAWRVTLPKTRGLTSPSRAAGPSAVLERLIQDAFAPWGNGSRQTTVALLEICSALTGRDVSRDHLHRRPGEAGWRHRLEAVREVLLGAADSGWLLCEPAVRVSPDPFEEPADTLREPPLPEPQPTTWFELRVVDEVGEPVPDVNVAFGIGGSRRVVATDGRGIARLEDMSTSFVSATVANVAQIRDKLAPRWKKPRASKLPLGPDVHVAALDAVAQSVSLEAERKATLAITPVFRCNELSGVHFAFGRSFVLESALDTLSVIAAAVVEDDNRRAMIFGHTDTAGDEALHKELSERRAKALFAILTHDPDAWEELWTGSADGPRFKEQWGVKEAQHLLNALGVPDDQGEALVEDGIEGSSTKQALERFQRGDYDGALAGRTALAETGRADRATRRELLLSYASLVTRVPLPKERFSPIGNASFMGCGEYNPVSDHARDEASRRAVVFVFDAAAEPQNLPCKPRALGPCRSTGGVDHPPAESPADGKPYRCAIYREVAKSCPCVQGEELMHLAVQLHDRDYNPVPETHYALVLDGERHHGTTDSDGVLHAAVRKSQLAFAVTYQPANERTQITLQAQVFPPELDETEQALLQKIRNLGFFRTGDSEAFAIRKFQDAHKNLARTGRLDGATEAALRDIDEGRLRDAFADGERESPANGTAHARDGGLSSEDGPRERSAQPAKRFGFASNDSVAVRDTPATADGKPVGDARKATPKVVRAKLAPEQRIVLVLTLRDRWGSPVPNLKLSARQAGADLKAPGGAALVTDAAGRTIVDAVLPAAPLEIKLDDQHLPADDEDRRKVRYVYTVEERPDGVIELQVDDDPAGALDVVDTKRAYVTMTVGVDLFRPTFRFPWQNPVHREEAEGRMYRRRVPNLRHALTQLFSVPRATVDALDHDALVAKLVELFEKSQATLAAEAATPRSDEATEMGTAPEPAPPSEPAPAPPEPEPGPAPPVQTAERPVPVRDVTPKLDPAPSPTPAPPPKAPDAATDSAALPRWVYYLLFHNTGLRYSPPLPPPRDKEKAGAHGCYVKPGLVLDRLRQLEIEASFGDGAGAPDATTITEALVLIEQKKAPASQKAALLSKDAAKTKRALAAIFAHIKNAELQRLERLRTPDKFYDGDYVALGLLKAKHLARHPGITDDLWKQVVSRTQLRNDVQAHGWEDIDPNPALLRAFFGKQPFDTTQWRSRRQQTLDTLISYAVCDQTSETGELIRSGHVGLAIPGNAGTPTRLQYLTFSSAKSIRRGMHFFFTAFGLVRPGEQPYVRADGPFDPAAIFESSPDPGNPKKKLLELTPKDAIGEIADLDTLADPDDRSNKAAAARTAAAQSAWKEACAKAKAVSKPTPIEPLPVPPVVLAPGKEFTGARLVDRKLIGNARDGVAIVRCVQDSTDRKFRLHACKWTHQEIVVDVKVTPSAIKVFTFSTGGGDDRSSSGIRVFDLVPPTTTSAETKHLDVVFGFMHPGVRENTTLLDASLLNPNALRKT